MKNIALIILSIFLATCASSCTDNYVSSIPNSPVNLQLNLTSTYSTFKNSVNQYLLFEKRINAYDAIGYGGILVCSGIGLDDSGNSQYYAFDMACPYEVDKDIKVYPDKDGLGKVVCEKCGSVYDVGYGFGNPVSGPAKEILKRYKTSLSGDNLFIYQ